MSGAPQRRVFFALVPGAGTRAALQGLARRYAPAGGRRVPARDLHLTLLFLGSVPEAELPRLRAVAASAAAAPLTVVLDRLERWRGGLLCATGAVDPALLALHRQLADGARDAGFRIETRPFRVHVTLARGLPRAAGDADAPIAALRWRVRSFCLMESGERADGGRYSALARWRLDGARDAAVQHDREAAAG